LYDTNGGRVFEICDFGYCTISVVNKLVVTNLNVDSRIASITEAIVITISLSFISYVRAVVDCIVSTIIVEV